MSGTLLQGPLVYYFLSRVVYAYSYLQPPLFCMITFFKHSEHFQMTRVVTALAQFVKAYLMAKLSLTVEPIMWRGLTNTFQKIFCGG